MTSSERPEYETTADRSLVIANRIAEVRQDERTVHVFVALSMIIGHMAAQAEFPDFEATMKLVSEGALDSFRQERQKMQASPYSASGGSA
ncbi:hypothetical protein WMC41_16025 [Shinella yambaruensis]|uniref:hypothetical protein n=1 Tax=Shinella yambaruensis TaxID=415996 RepID=UPI003D7B2ABD